jgi:glycosyltransferase involved in cell wall biosynthesis
MTSPKYAGLFEYGGAYGGAYLLRRSLFMPWELPDVMDADMAREGWLTLQPIFRMDDMLGSVRGNHARVSALELTRYMRNTLLRDSDWASMAHSLEVRVPLVDVDLFRALLPILTRENISLSKRGMAQAPAKPWPSDVTNRPKTGFAIPVQQWLESDAQDSRLRGLRGWSLQVYQSFGFSRETRHTRRKRVLALVSDAFGSNGGIAKYNRDLLSAVSVHPKVSSVTALSRSKGSNSDFNDKPLNLYYDERGAGEKWHYARELFIRLRDYGHFDIIVCGHINLLPIAYIAAKFSRATLWGVFHGIEAWQPHVNMLVNQIIRCLNGFIAVSNVTMDRFAAWSGISRDAGFLLPNSYDPSSLSPGFKSEVLVERYGLQNKKILMTLGRLSADEQYKGFDEVLECLPSLMQKIPNLSYLIVGDGGDLNRLKQKAKRLGVAARVIFAGFIPESEKADYYRLADVYVMPGRGEGFGIVYLEAMACGIPAIGSKVDGSRDALRDGQLGILVDPSNPQELESAILQALAQTTRQPPPGLEYFNLYSFRQRAFQFLDRALEEKTAKNLDDTETRNE